MLVETPPDQLGWLAVIDRLQRASYRSFIQQKYSYLTNMINTNHKLQAVLFDVDGTLADTEQDGPSPCLRCCIQTT